MNLFDTLPDIPCMCAVEQRDKQTGGGSWQWEVIVRTAPFWPRFKRRVYYIEAASDTIAAHEGIRRFVEEDKEERLLKKKLITVH